MGSSWDTLPSREAGRDVRGLLGVEGFESLERMTLRNQFRSFSSGQNIPPKSCRRTCHSLQTSPITDAQYENMLLPLRGCCSIRAAKSQRGSSQVWNHEGHARALSLP